MKNYLVFNVYRGFNLVPVTVKPRIYEKKIGSVRQERKLSSEKRGGRKRKNSVFNNFSGNVLFPIFGILIRERQRAWGNLGESAIVELYSSNNSVILLYIEVRVTLRPALPRRVTCSELTVSICCAQRFRETSLNLRAERRTTQIKFRRAISRISAAGNPANFFSCTSRINRTSDSLARETEPPGRTESRYYDRLYTQYNLGEVSTTRNDDSAM